MNSLKLLFDNFILKIELLMNRLEVLSDEEQAINRSQIISLYDSLDGILSSIEEAKVNSVFSSQYLSLYSLLSSNKQYVINQLGEYGFNEGNYSELEISCRIAHQITNSEVENEVFDCEYDTDKYDLYIITDIDVSEEALPFYYFDNDKNENSFFCFSKLDTGWANELEITNNELLYYLLYHLDKLESYNENKTYVITSKSFTDDNDVIAFVKMIMVVSGRVIHTPINISYDNNFYTNNEVENTNKYIQFNEVFTILSEFNSRNEIFNKFLSLYHIIENFMFKMPLVELEAQNNGQMFSIRQFKTMYSKVSSSEQDSLKALIKRVFLEEVGGESIEKKILDLFNSINISNTECCSILDSLNLPNNLSFSELQDGIVKSLKDLYPKLVYKYRNVIVHNKETEFHLSHHSVPVTHRRMLEEFIIPSMEIIIVYLITVKNSITWYQNAKIELF